MFTIKQSAERIGDRGTVHDTYVLECDGVAVALLHHYVEYSIGEVPITFEPVIDGEFPLFVKEPIEIEDTDEQIALRSSAH